MRPFVIDGVLHLAVLTLFLQVSCSTKAALATTISLSAFGIGLVSPDVRDSRYLSISVPILDKMRDKRFAKNRRVFDDRR